jgi:hypothetical protein
MTTAAEVFDPQLLRALRAAPWRSIERPFLCVLAASISLHIGFASYLASQPMPVTHEPTLDEMDRFEPARALPPLHPLPKQPPLAEPTTSVPVRPALSRPAAVDPKKIANTGMIRLLTAPGEGAFRELLESPANEISEALRDARTTQVFSAAPLGPKAAASGQVATVGTIGTEGVKKVSLGTRAEQAPAALATGPILAEKSDELDPRLLQQFITARRAALQSCYERALLHNPAMQGGKVVLRLTLGAGGRVGELEVEEDTLGSEAVTSCMSTLVRRWMFPVALKEELQVSVPFIFARAG